MIFCIALALAGAPEDVAIAADTDQPRNLRESAFGRLAEPAMTDRVLGLIADTDTTSDHRWVLIRSLGANPSSEAREALLRKLKMDFVNVRTDRPYVDALVAFFKARARRLAHG